MNNNDIIKQIEQIEKQLKYLKGQFKSNQPEQMSPSQKAIKVITASKSTVEQVKESLQVLIETPQTLSVKQTAFIIYFSLLNKPEVGQDIDYFIKIELGKRKYDQRTSFIAEIQDVLDKNYNNNRQFKLKLLNYLESFKK